MMHCSHMESVVTSLWTIATNGLWSVIDKTVMVKFIKAMLYEKHFPFNVTVLPLCTGQTLVHDCIWA